LQESAFTAGSPWPDGVINPDGCRNKAKIDVYRNNVIVSLIECALPAAFPVVQVPLLAKNFLGCSKENRKFISRSASPVMLGIRNRFPGLSGRFPPAASVPYLGAVGAVGRAPPVCIPWPPTRNVDPAQLNRS